VIPKGAILVQGDSIAEIGDTSELLAKHRLPLSIDAKNKIILPGFICAHHHLYSTMARGFAPPGEPAASFGQILEQLWWKLDKALLREDVRSSALIPLVECIRNGTTTIFDHHASPSFREGSLELIADAVLESGIRACLCYEVSDRNGAGAASIQANKQFLERVEKERSPFLTGMMGIHASFTVSDETLSLCRQVAEQHGVGYHIHVAEGPEDVEQALREHGMRPVERLVKLGISGERTLFIHCVNINEGELELIEKTKTMVAHNPESNMNNAVGVAPILELMRRGILVVLGTDGMASDMPAQMRCAYLVHRLAKRDPRVAFLEAPRMLLWNNAELANRYFSRKVGVLEAGATADVVLLDYIPPTELNENNFLGHFIFGMTDATVDTTIVGGKILMQNKHIISLDEEKIAAESRKLATEVWRRIK
jgi:putative selenium metabolism protein SsnA